MLFYYVVSQLIRIHSKHLSGGRRKHQKVAPDTYHRDDRQMKRLIIPAVALILSGTAFSASAQKKAIKLMEQTEARYVEPRVQVYITPQVADMEMLTKERETYGPYRFDTNGVETLTQYMIDECKKRALYNAITEAEGDALIEPIYNVQTLSTEPKVMLVTLSGYPVKYVNFHPLKDPKELETMRIVYTGNYGNTSAAADEKPAAPVARKK